MRASRNDWSERPSPGAESDARTRRARAPTKSPRLDARKRSPEAILALQRAAGNRVTVAVLARRSVTVELRRPPPLPPAEPALDRATPENRELAAEIDALASLTDAELVKRRTEVTKQLPLHAVTATERDEQARLRRALQAIEYVAAERASRARWVGDDAASRLLGPVEPDWRHWGDVRHDPVRRRAWVRWLVEQRVREERSFEGALKVIRSTATYGADLSEIDDDLEGIEQEARAFAAEFRAQARRNAERMLAGSMKVIDRTLRDYGLPVAAAHAAAREWRLSDESVPAHHTSLAEAAAEVVEKARGSDEVNLEANWKRRRDLGETAARLKHLQQKVLTTQKVMWQRADATGGRAAAEKAAFVAAKDELASAWFAAERAHPVLAAYRGRRERDRRQAEDSPLAKIDLGALDTDRAEPEMRAVLEHVLPTLAHIQKAADKLAGGMSPLKLPTAVALTEANMFIPAGSIRDGVVHDLVAAESREQWLVVAAGLALSLVTLVPTLGASLPMINVAAGALAAYSALQELEEYDLQKVLVDTDLDKARSLSQADPSLAGFAWSLVSLGLEPLMAIHALKTASKLRGLLRRGERVTFVVDELNRIGGRRMPDLGNRALAEAEEAERLAKGAAKPPTSEPRVTVKTPPEPSPNASPPAKKTVTSAKETGEELYEKTAGKQQPPKGGGSKQPGGDPEGAGKGAPKRRPARPDPPAAETKRVKEFKPPPVDELQNKDVYTPVKQQTYDSVDAFRAGIHEALAKTASGRSYAGALIDKVRAVLRRISMRVKANRDLAKLLEKVYAIVRDPKVVEEAAVSLWEEAARRQKSVRAFLEERMGGRFRIVEDELTRDVLQADEPFIDHTFASQGHGAHTHLFSEYLIDFKLGAGEGRRFRQAVANAVGPDIVEAGKTQEFWEAVWNAVFDVTDEGNQIHRPEVLGPILQEHLGLPRFKP